MTRRRRSSRRSALRVERQRKAEIGVEGALVELVEQHGGDAVEGRVVEDHAGEHALGHHLDAGLAADLRAEANPQADGLADRFAERLRHALRCGAGGEAARLEQDELAARDPGFVEKRQSGTRVVLPAPGGATSTAFGRARRRAVRSPRTASMGSGCLESAHGA